MSCRLEEAAEIQPKFVKKRLPQAVKTTQHIFCSVLGLTGKSCSIYELKHSMYSYMMCHAYHETETDILRKRSHFETGYRKTPPPEGRTHCTRKNVCA